MKLLNVIAAAAVIGASFIAVYPAEAFWWNKNKEKRRGNAISINHQQFVNDYQRNSARFNKNWVGPVNERLFVKASGYVSGAIENWGFTFKTPYTVTLKNGKKAEFMI